MKIKSGLPANLNLADMFLPPEPAKIAENATIPAEIQPVQEEPSSLVNKEETPSQPAKKPKQKKKSAGQFGWKQTGISLSESTILRLKLESFKTGKTLSEIADSLLARYLPNHKISA